MNKLINIILTITTSIAIFLIILLFTLFNINYIKHQVDKYNYYDTIYTNIMDKTNNELDVDKDKIKNDVNNYISSYFMDKTYTVSSYQDIYNDEIKFIKPYKNMRLYHDIFSICTIIIVIIVGMIYLKTKGMHNLNIIFIISFIIGIITSIILKLNISYSNIIGDIFNNYTNTYLITNIILLLITIIYIIKNNIVNNK